MSYIKFDDVCKKYGKNQNYSVHNFNLEINKGEFIAFVGPSGCGKTTTIRMLAGLEEISEGTIEIEGKVINSLMPNERDIAMVFQNYALYPHMTVGENITCGLEARKAPKEEIVEKLKWASEILGLEDYLDKKPGQLSGGQKQRVAVGRAMVRNPKVFLMDEPLSNLDAKLRTSMRSEISKLHRDLHATTIYVTHDQVEAMTMADRLVIMKFGVIQQIGTPKEVYLNPINKFVAGFIGAPQMNFFNAKVSGDQVTLLGQTVTVPDGREKEKIVKERMAEKNISGDVVIGIRPEFIHYRESRLERYNKAVITAKVDNIEELGSEMIVHLVCGEERFMAKFDADFEGEIGDEIKISIAMHKVSYFDKDTEQSLLF